MANERLGIVEEAAARREYVRRHQEAIQRRMALPREPVVRRNLTPFPRPRPDPQHPGYPPMDHTTTVRLMDVVRAVSVESGIKVSELMGLHRRRRVSWPRQVAMFVIHCHCHCTLSQIGRFFRRDHTTVMHAIQVMHKRLQNDEPSSVGDLLVATKKRLGI